LISSQEVPAKLYTVFNRRLEVFSQRHCLCLIALNEWIDLFHSRTQLKAGICESMLKNIPLDAIGLARIETFMNTYSGSLDEYQIDFPKIFDTQVSQSAIRSRRL